MHYSYASFLQRFVAWCIDFALVFVFLVLLGYVLPRNPFVGLLITYVYFVLMLRFARGATIGKRLMHIRVITATGRSPGIFAGIVREIFGKILSGVFNIGYIWMIIHPQGRTWHDMLAGTWVVKVDQDGEIVLVQEKQRSIGMFNYMIAIVLLVASIIPIVITAKFIVDTMLSGNVQELFGNYVNDPMMAELIMILDEMIAQ